MIAWSIDSRAQRLRAQGLLIVGHGERESVSITLTPALSLKGEGVGCLVDEPVSQIIERPWASAGAGSHSRVGARGRVLRDVLD